jgi:hypothetical protein
MLKLKLKNLNEELVNAVLHPKAPQWTLGKEGLLS